MIKLIKIIKEIKIETPKKKLVLYKKGSEFQTEEFMGYKFNFYKSKEYFYMVCPENNNLINFIDSINKYLDSEKVPYKVENKREGQISVLIFKVKKENVIVK